MGFLHRFLADETGATAIEYGLIVALISVGTLGGIGYYGDSLLTLYEGILDEVLAAV